MSALTQSQREELRDQVLEQLAVASTVAFPAEVVTRRVNRSQLLDFEAAEGDVSAALQFLVSQGHATSTPHPRGATLHYQATAAGVLAHERGT